MLIMDYKYVKA